MWKKLRKEAEKDSFKFETVDKKSEAGTGIKKRAGKSKKVKKIVKLQSCCGVIKSAKTQRHHREKEFHYD